MLINVKVQVPYADNKAMGNKTKAVKPSQGFGKANTHFIPSITNLTRGGGGGGGVEKIT
jgi:hypothetical protein